MKPEILICLYAFYPYANSNTNVMLPIIEKLKDKYQVNILTKNNDNKSPKYECYDDLNIYRYNNNKFLYMLHCISLIDNKKRRIFLKKLLISIFQHVSKFLLKFKLFKNNQYKLLCKLMSEKTFVCVISTCESFTSHLNVLDYKKKYGLSIPWIAYYMDPYAYTIGNLNGTDTLIEREKEVYRNSDCIIVTEEIFEENQTNAFKEYLYKTKPIKFGNFRYTNSNLKNYFFVPGKINCVYVGSLLNVKIRDPRYLYKMMNEIDDRFVFHMICNNFTKENEMVRDKILHSKNVFWYKNLPLDECLGIMSHADILINLGNKSINQTPSKVFDYISTGRPIVNIYSLEKDTSKRYLEKYPHKINIFEDNDNLQDSVDQFVQYASGKLLSVSKEELNELYKDYLSENVTSEMENMISNVIYQQKDT